MKICIWMNVKTHHQSAFFEALALDSRFDLQVRYFEPVPEELLKKGFGDGGKFSHFEKSVYPCREPLKMMETLPDWRERTHLTAYSFCPDLVDFFIQEKVLWCQWSERCGMSLASVVNFHVWLFKLLYPLYALLKFKEAKAVREHALCVFGQGDLARKTFRLLEIPNAKIFNLFYSTAPLFEQEKIPEVEYWKGRDNLFVYVGNLWRCKGVDLLLKAFSFYHHGWKLLIIGPDLRNGYYCKMCTALNLDQYVKFTGAVDKNDIAAYLSSADVLILPSRYDGWGAVLNEAASMGKALISTDQVGAAWHLIRQNENGYRIKAGSVSSLAWAIKKYIDDPLLAQKHGIRSKEIFYSEFTPQKNVERLYDALLCQKK